MGTQNSFNNQIAGSYNQIILNAGTNGVAISTDASAATVNVATGGAVKTATFGSTNSTSTTTVQSGSGALNVTATGGALTINSGVGALGISTDASATTISIGTGGAVKAVTIGSTNSTSSLALNFSGSTGSTLSNYTARTAWTPVLKFGGGTTGITYTTQTGSYSRIGSIVTFTLQITLSNKGSSTGAATITGLPLTPFAPTAIQPLLYSNTTFTGVPVVFLDTLAVLNLDSVITTGGATPTIMTELNFTNTSIIVVSGSYLI